MSTRDDLIHATRDLLAENGYVATSPRDILRRSGAGQGSMYHHFRGKSDLAGAALTEVSAAMRDEADRLLGGGGDPLGALRAWLGVPRRPLEGCRLGRLVAEPIQDEEDLMQPIASYFGHITTAITDRLRQAQVEGSLRGDIAADDLAHAVVAVIQGGFVLARATGDPSAMTRAQRAAVALLSPMSTHQPGGTS